ncbi:hypothetical protein Hanom_Chr08g00730251 [Helianthus anomalus]
MKKRKRSGDDDDDLYIPSPEHVQEVQTPPSEGRKKFSARKRVVSPAARKLKIKFKSKPASEPQQPLSEPQAKPHQSPPQQPVPDPIPSSPKQPSPPHQQSPQSSPQLHISTPTHEQPIITSPHKLQKKVEEVLVENKKLEKHVKFVEAENSSLLKKVEVDQADIDILNVRITELDEEKARRDEQNEYFKLKNKELVANNAKKEHEMYMMNKVLENLIGKPVEQRFEEIELEEVRARRKAEIEAKMKNKGKGVQVEVVSEVTERAIVPSIVSESPIQNPCPISSVSGVFDDDIVVDDVEDDDEEDDEEEDEEIRKDNADDVYSASSHDDDDGIDDNDQGSTGIKVAEASTEENVDDYLHDDANEEPENAESEGEHDDTKNVDESDDHVSRLILRLEHGVEEGEILHTYSLAEIIKMTHIDENEFKFDFEEELNKFDINQ